MFVPGGGGKPHLVRLLADLPENLYLSLCRDDGGRVCNPFPLHASAGWTGKPCAEGFAMGLGLHTVCRSRAEGQGSVEPERSALFGGGLIFCEFTERSHTICHAWTCPHGCGGQLLQPYVYDMLSLRR